MRYINKKSKQLIIETPIQKSKTKQTKKDGTKKENIKYISHIPRELLIFLLEKFNKYDPKIKPGEYIDLMLNGETKYYLQFKDNINSGFIELQIGNDKIINDNVMSVTIKKQSGTSSYFFTVSKMFFSELKNNDNSVSAVRFILCFDDGNYCFKNSIVYMKLV